MKAHVQKELISNKFKIILLTKMIYFSSFNSMTLSFLLNLIIFGRYMKIENIGAIDDIREFHKKDFNLY